MTQKTPPSFHPNYAHVLFADPEDVRNPQPPDEKRRVISAMCQVIKEQPPNHRASVGDMHDALLVYVTWYGETCIGLKADPLNRSCEEWWVVASSDPQNDYQKRPAVLRVHGPIKDESLLASLKDETLAYFSVPQALAW